MTPIRKILVPTDFSACAAVAVDHAVELAKRLEAEVRLLHVLPIVPFHVPGADMIQFPAEWVEDSRNAALAALSKEARRIAGIGVTTEVREGTLHEGILAAAAESKADMIVIGTHGRTGLSHALIGSVAERVVRASPVPVLTVRKRP
jgi:universal stress protein A